MEALDAQMQQEGVTPSGGVKRARLSIDAEALSKLNETFIKGHLPEVGMSKECPSTPKEIMEARKVVAQRLLSPRKPLTPRRKSFPAEVVSPLVYKLGDSHA